MLQSHRDASLNTTVTLRGTGLERNGTSAAVEVSVGGARCLGIVYAGTDAIRCRVRPVEVRSGVIEIVRGSGGLLLDPAGIDAQQEWAILTGVGSSDSLGVPAPIA